MPQVGNKKFPYTPKGMARAKQLREKLRNPAARPSMPSGPGRPQVTLPSGQRVPARGPGRGPLTFPPSRRPLPDKTGMTPPIPERTPPAFGRPSVRPITKPMPRPTGGARPPRRPGRPGLQVISSNDPNWKPIRPGKPGRPGRPGFGIRPFPRPKPPNRRYR